jgi:hypothetical protein
MSEHPTPDGIMKLGLGFWGSKAFLSAIELGLFTALAEGPLNADDLVAKLELHERGARDFLDALVALGMLERDDGAYRNTRDTAVFLDRNLPSYIGGILEMANHRLYGFWGNLTEALRTGKPQNEVAGGKDFFGELYAEPDRLKEFLYAMLGISVGPATFVAQKFPWKDYKTVIDIGTATGTLPVEVAKAHAHITGGGFDLPPVQATFEEYVAKHDLADRLAFHAGSFFTDDLPPADVLVFGHILHDWDLEQKHMLIGKAFDALPSGGAVIIYEFLIDDDRRANAMGLLMSLNMLIETPGGFDYTGADCRGWLEAAGFKDIRVEHLVGPESMVVGIKA